MNKAVFEAPDCLIDLCLSRGVEQESVFFCNDRLRTKLYPHGCDQIEEQIISAAGGAVDHVIVRIGTVVVAVAGIEHGGASFLAVVCTCDEPGDAENGTSGINVPCSVTFMVSKIGKKVK